MQNLRRVRAELLDGLRAVSSGAKLPEAQAIFRSVLQSLLFVAVTSDEEAKEVKSRLFAYCRHILTRYSGAVQ